MKNIIFDFGGVLIDWNPDYFYHQYFNYDQSQMQAFYTETSIKEVNVELDKGLEFDVALKALAVLNTLTTKPPFIVGKSSGIK